MKPVEVNYFVMFQPWWRIEVELNCAVINTPKTFPPIILDLRPESCMFYLVSTISNVFCI